MCCVVCAGVFGSPGGFLIFACVVVCLCCSSSSHNYAVQISRTHTPKLKIVITNMFLAFSLLHPPLSQRSCDEQMLAMDLSHTRSRNADVCVQFVRVYMGVSICACMRVRVYACVHACVRVCRRMCMCLWVHVRVRMFM